jgi:hypothetical protein
VQVYSRDLFRQIFGEAGDDQWNKFVNSLNTVSGHQYYGTAVSTGSYALRPGYIASLYAAGEIGVETFSGIIEYTDPDGNLYPSILEQMGLTDRYYKELDELNQPDDGSGDNSGEGSGYAEGDQVAWEDMTEEERNAHAVRRYETTGETNPWYDQMSQEEIDAAYEYLKTDGDPGVYGTQDGVDYSLNPETSTWNDIEEALIEAGYDQEFVNDLLYDPENGLIWDRTNQNAVTLENILGQITGQNWNVLQLPTEQTLGTFRVDLDGDGVYDTVVRCANGGVACSEEDWQVVHGADIDITDPKVRDQIRNAQIFDEAQTTEGWDDLEDWEKNKILNDSGYTGPFVFGDGSTEPPLTPDEELERDYGAEAVQKAKEIYDGLKDWVDGAIDDPQGTLVNILENILPQIPEECINEGEAGVDYPEDWWKDCTNVSVLLPGLNIPLPPGMIDVNTTIRDLENAANEVGKTLEDIFSGEDDRSISEILGDWASDVWEGIKDAWEDLEDKTDAGLINILIDMGYSILGPLIFSQIKDTIIGNTNPFAFVQNCYDSEWRGQSAENQAFCNEALDQGALIRCADGSYRETQAECAEGEFGFCEDGTTQKTDAEGRNCEEWGGEFGWCTDKREKRKEDAEGTNCDGYVAPFDCSSVGREEPAGGEKATNADDCGACLDPDFEIQDAGQCADPNTLTEKEQECADKGLKYDDLNDRCLDECVVSTKTPTGPNGECVDPPWTNPVDAPTEQDCTSRGKTFIPADEANQKASECGDCTTEGWVHDGVGTNCYDPNPQPEPCPGNQQRFDGENCEEPCEFDSTKSVSDPDCKDPNTGTNPQAGDPCDSNGDGVQDGTLQANESGELECVAGPDLETCQDGSTPDPDKGCREDWCDDAMTIPKNEDGSCPEGPVEECVKPDGTPTGATVESGCEKCPQGQDFNENGVCVGVTTGTCSNGATNYPLCTECADGSTTDPNTPCGGVGTCSNGATNYPLCTECADGSTTDLNTPCGGVTTVCDDPTATNYGEEGECIYGPTPNPCDDAVYASENPLECGWVECPDGSFAPTQEQCGGGCPEGQEPCEALGGECTTPENCPGGGGEGGGGGGGGGGGAGMFEPFTAGISGDPQLLARQEFPITDYLAGLFKGIV